MRAPLLGRAFFMPLATFVALLTLTPRVAMSATRMKALTATRSPPATPPAATRSTAGANAAAGAVSSTRVPAVPRSPPATPPAVPRSPQARAHVVSLSRFRS